MVARVFSIKYRKKGQVGCAATTTYRANDSSEAKKKWQKDHPGCEIIEMKQTQG
jgi:hypothetical protein